ncbi:MAG: hypothetical protein QMB62_03425 [Oscillospiraceae bacterium]
MPRDMEIRKSGNIYELRRDQWRGRTAQISDYPGLLDEVKKHTWTFSNGEHPYLTSGNPKVSLHKFVLSFLYGTDKVDQMLGANNIIEHLDNDGLNCTYDNLHIISSDYNKAKAFTIDKEKDDFSGVPLFITDVYYSHSKKYYQMQVFLNRDLYFNQSSGVPVEEFFFLYIQFSDLFLDWLDLLHCQSTGFFDVRKFHFDKVLWKERPAITLREEEKDYSVIERDGQYYLVLRTDGSDKMAFMKKTAYRDLQELQP